MLTEAEWTILQNKYKLVLLQLSVELNVNF